MIKHYKAHVINSTERWSWEGNKPGDANPSWQPGTKQQPIFQRGDTMVLRLEQNKGPHTVKLTNKGAPAKLPFAYPFDLHTFHYNPDTDVLVFAGLEGRLDKAVWSLSIKSDAGGPDVDPEFQVGPGGISGDNEA